MKKIMMIVLAAAALLLCGCGNEAQSNFNDFNDEYIEIVLPPRQKMINVQKPHGEAARFLTRPFKAGEKAEEYFYIATGSLTCNYKIKEQE